MKIDLENLTIKKAHEDMVGGGRKEMLEEINKTIRYTFEMTERKNYMKIGRLRFWQNLICQKKSMSLP